MKNDNIGGPTIIDNFLAEEDFITIRDYIFAFHFSWNFSTTVVWDGEKPSPGQLAHLVYKSNIPTSGLYNVLIPIINNQFKITALWRVQANLLLRLPEPFYYQFHSDTGMDMEEDVAAQWTTSILYMNTNNGYTEFEDGTIVESVANRLVSFPSIIKHRGVSQTDEQTRIVMNFNYLKPKGIS